MLISAIFFSGMELIENYWLTVWVPELNMHLIQLTLRIMNTYKKCKWLQLEQLKPFPQNQCNNDTKVF